MKPKKKSKAERREGEWPKRVAGVIWFVLGTVFGLFVVQWFVSLLPGPNVNASVSGLRVTKGNAAGCTAYMLVINTEDPVEYFYAKVQFPTKVTNYKIGFPSESQTQASGRMQMQAWELGRDTSGRCVVVQAAVNNEVDVQASAEGNMIGVHGAKLSPKSVIMGLVATSDSESSVTPRPEMYTEGAYEYLKLGQTVRKQLAIQNSGVTDTK